MKLLTISVTLLLSISVDGRRSTTASSSIASSVPRRRASGKQRAFINNKQNYGVGTSSLTPPSSSVTKDIRGGDGGGTATMQSEMFNMVKAVVGVGVLSLPAGKFYRYYVIAINITHHHHTFDGVCQHC